MTDEGAEEGHRRAKSRSRQGQAYQGAVEAVFAILVAVGIGYWADERFTTSPRYVLIGLVIGFGYFVLRLVRLGRQLQAHSDDDSQ